jgi:hypothetical protein
MGKDREIKSLMEAIRAMTGEFAHYDEIPESTPIMDGDKQRIAYDEMGAVYPYDDEHEYVMRAEKTPLSENQIFQILNEWSKSKLYRPMKEGDDIVDKYPQFFLYPSERGW